MMRIFCFLLVVTVVGQTNNANAAQPIQQPGQQAPQSAPQTNQPGESPQQTSQPVRATLHDQDPSPFDHLPAEIQQTLQAARALEESNRFAEAVTLWDQATEQLAQHFGQDQWQVTNAKLASSLATQRASFQADQQQKIQEIGELQLTTINFLKRGDMANALPIIERAEALTAELFGAETHLLAQIKTQKAGVLHNLGRLNEAWTEYRDALTLARRTFGAFHPDTELIYYKLGTLLQNTANSGRAIDHLTQAVNVSKTVYGELHPIYADRLTTLGVAMQSTQQYERALQYLLAGEKVQTEVLGPGHQRRAQTLRDIGVTYLSMHEPTEAVKFLRSSIDILVQTMSNIHPFVLNTKTQLATALAMDKESEQAEQVLRQVLEGSLETFGADHPSTAKTQFQLAVTLGNQKNFPEACQLLNQSLNTHAAQLGYDHPMTHRTGVAYARMLEKNGDPDAAAKVQQLFANQANQPATQQQAQNPTGVNRK